MKQENIYRIRVQLDDPEDIIYRDLLIFGENTLEVLKQWILKSFGLKSKMLVSFYICDEKGYTKEEIVSAEIDQDMGMRTLDQVDFQTIIQESPALIFAAHGIKLRYFHIENLGRVTVEKDAKVPFIVSKKGELSRK